MVFAGTKAAMNITATTEPSSHGGKGCHYPILNYGLYHSENERDSCGTGMAADLNNMPSRRIVDIGLGILKRLMHRGAAGNDPETSDGAGITTALPDEMFRRQMPGVLPGVGQYGVAMIFNGVGQEAAIENIIRAEGLETICWRTVPIRQEALGQIARESCPTIRQLFINGARCGDQSHFERRLYIVRRLIEKEVDDCYICSSSSRQITYKGLVLATRLEIFYVDLAQPDFKSPFALVHQRYSTNTFPTWSLAQPFRFLAHNGEINTLRGNLNHLKSREPHLASPEFGDDLAKVLPLIAPGQSDSACLDNMLELLVHAGRSLPHAMLMLIPQAWGKNYHMGKDVRGFLEYHSALMEPWDGPAAIVFSDGVNTGAILDRNGLRPARYTLTRDRLFILASETGVADIAPEEVLERGRLKPGEMIYCDLANHRLVRNGEIKKTIARQRPYRRWAEENRISVHGLFDSIHGTQPSGNLPHWQRIFGYTEEDIDLIIKPMAEKGSEPIGSMGSDTPLAVLSRKPQLLFQYFRQLFAQVTNPPIDPIREELVMSLTTYIGNKANILEETPAHARLIKLPRPILTNDELTRLRNVNQEGFHAQTLPMGFPRGGNGQALSDAIQRLANQACQAARDGIGIIILSDKNLRGSDVPIPSLLAAAAVNRALTLQGLRPEIGLILETGEPRETMHFALLLGYGATAINPYVALETVAQLAQDGQTGSNIYTTTEHYIKALDHGLLKIMSKMGISTLRSYRSSQLFEAVGLVEEVISAYFPGTASRIGGLTLDDIARETNQRLDEASQPTEPIGPHGLPVGGQYSFKKGGETHLLSPQALSIFRQAVRQNDETKYREFARMINDQSGRPCTLRSLLRFRSQSSVPLESVESEESIIRKFVSGAMSLGSLSPEAHESIAIAMNHLGSMSNSGEGGEDEARLHPLEDGNNRSSAIRQVASGRFGVTISYLCHARELQIKMAQGAKPGEGGQLPGAKIDAYIAKIRHSIPNITLISPPPHHDIYSVEDLAQLIYDLRHANPEARISVKLASESGIGAVAAGVAKGHADVILISGHDGGTGASPLSSIRYAGLPWELGLAEVQQTLVLNNLRSRVKLQADGQIKTGRDVMIAALLGAEEFVFGTMILVSLGCAMLRRCHLNTCPVGIATQNPALRNKFTGKPEFIENYLHFVARETREYLAALGLHSLDEAIGRADLLEYTPGVDLHYKTQHLDFSKLLRCAKGKVCRFDPATRPQLAASYDRQQIIPSVIPVLDNQSTAELNLGITNADRAVGTELSYAVARRFGEQELKDNSVALHFHGCAGQSFGAFLASGITLELFGEANDFVGKGLSGGVIIIRPEPGLASAAARHVIAGNVVGYGATAGKIFINGIVGERFAVRNSGAIVVAEGVGDHGCEYMTGGRVVVLGETGVNFAAGMTGGIAYVYDKNNDFDLRCNTESVDLENVEPLSPDDAELLELVYQHYKATGSETAHNMLNDWPNARPNFVKVCPIEYRQALAHLQGSLTTQPES